jgi:iron complex outermembrane receptor protein
VCRAVRTPSRGNQDIDSIGILENPLAGDPRFIALKDAGNRAIEAEDMMAYELGIRAQPTDWIHFDLAAYYNVYDDLIIYDVLPVQPFINLPAVGGGTPSPETAIIARSFSNHGSASAWGFEFFARLQLLEDHTIVKKWWVDATYSYVDVDIDRDEGIHLGSISDFTGDPIAEDQEDAKGFTEAHHTLGMRSHMNFAWDLALDLAYFYVSSVERVGKQNVASYHCFDLRAAWRPTENIAAWLAVENLFDAGHDEWNSELFIAGTKIPRSVYARLSLDF